METVNEPEHVAWCRYVIEHDKPTRIVLCDSDDEGAFKVCKISIATAAVDRVKSLENALDMATQGKYSEPMLTLAAERGKQIADGLAVCTLKGQLEEAEQRASAAEAECERMKKERSIVLPAVVTEEMLEAVATVLSRYPATLIWKRWLEVLTK